MCGNLKARSPPHTSFNDVLILTDNKSANGRFALLFPRERARKVSPSVSHQCVRTEVGD